MHYKTLRREECGHSDTDHKNVNAEKTRYITFSFARNMQDYTSPGYFPSSFAIENVESVNLFYIINNNYNNLLSAF